jgi:hypothetical protein
MRKVPRSRSDTRTVDGPQIDRERGFVMNNIVWIVVVVVVILALVYFLRGRA